MADLHLSVRTPQRSGFIYFFRKIRKNAGLYILIAPVILYFIIFQYWPMYGVQIAFKNFSPALGITGSSWAGFTHFERFFNSIFFFRILRNTIGISIYSLVIGIPAPVILALMFNEMKNKVIRTTCQTISYAPFFLSSVVVVGMMMFFLSPSNGVINLIINYFGHESINFITKPELFWHIYTWSGIWQGIGWGTIIYTASMAGIPLEQYEAVVIDGAGRLRKIWYVTIPGILPTMVIISILSAGNIMNVGFEKIFLLQNGLNIDTSEVIATYVYKSGLQSAQYSFASAVGLFNNVINFIILIGVNFLAKKVGETSLW